MEKVMSVEDKIKRAEEIYYRRKNQEMPDREVLKKPTSRKNIKLFKKMIKQIIICLLVYSICYIVINNNYIFSEDFTQKAREILSQDINLPETYNMILEKLNTIKQEVPETTENEVVEEKSKEEIQNNDENIGGAEELSPTQEQNVENIETTGTTSETNQQPTELSQMEEDVNYIKSTISLIKPVQGTISSMFGLRNPTTASVPKNHTGTDIAAKKGTKIVSATDGKVIYKSSKGDFGKHIKIQINDVIILYAHCNKIYVNEGDTIKQGQEIAEVGSTGNTTGPHLHFEIRYQERCVDPQLILEL
ncbi:MAG: M23 family metallopeptidase [Clostridia bacterium]|nr:M23 family metallopeptidase [Clostridia bacterium]